MGRLSATELGTKPAASVALPEAIARSSCDSRAWWRSSARLTTHECFSVFMSASFISLDVHSIGYAIETSAVQTNITCCVFLSYRFMITVFLESTNTRTNLVDARNASWG